MASARNYVSKAEEKYNRSITASRNQSKVEDEKWENFSSISPKESNRAWVDGAGVIDFETQGGRLQIRRFLSWLPSIIKIIFLRRGVSR